MKVVEDKELDGVTVLENEEHKVTSKLVFSDAAEVMPNFVFYGVSDVVFRKALNSNQTTFCTGFKFQDFWVFDRPDRGYYLDPLDLENPKKFRGEKPAEVGKIIVQELADGTEIRFENLILPEYENFNIGLNDKEVDTAPFDKEEVDEFDDKKVVVAHFTSSFTDLSDGDTYTIGISEYVRNASGNPGPQPQYMTMKLPLKSVGADGKKRFELELLYGDTLDRFNSRGMSSEEVTARLKDGTIGLMAVALGSEGPQEVFTFDKLKGKFVNRQGVEMKYPEDEPPPRTFQQSLNIMRIYSLDRVWADGRDLSEPPLQFYKPYVML